MKSQISFGIIGSGSWATAIAKILTDKGHTIGWWVRDEASIWHIKERGHNPRYLPAAGFNPSLLNLDAGVAFDIETPTVQRIPVEPLAELEPEAVYELALKALPQQKVNELRLQSAQKSVAAARGAMYPSFSAFGGLSTFSVWNSNI